MSKKGILQIKNQGQVLDYYPQTTYDNVIDEQGSNLSTDISDLKSFKTSTKSKLDGISNNANKTSKSTTNGNITIDGVETVVYTHPTSSGNKHIPSGGSSGQILRWSADGTAVWGAENNTTYSNATTTTSGLMSSTDKSKLDGIAAGANNYTHPSGDGNSHIPANGTSNSGKYLQATGTAGTYQWAALPTASTSAAGIVQLSSAVNSTSSTTAATASAVKAAYDLAAGKAPASHTHNYAGSSSAGGAATSALACTGNSATATKLATARTINGVSFDGTANITIADSTKLPLSGGTLTTSAFTGLTIKRSDVNGSAISYNNSNGQLGSAGFLGTGEYVVNLTSDTSGNLMKITSSNVTFGSKTVSATTFSGALSGNASTATKLQTARTINGTSFDGTANITTANWGTARTLTIGNTGKSVNGSANTSWSLAEIGAAIKSITHDTETFINEPVAHFKSGASTLTGIIKITLPYSWSSTMISFDLICYDYSSYGRYIYHISGYNYSTTSSSWVNTQFSTEGNPKTTTVRFAHDGSKCCILLGTTASTWSYPSFTITNVKAGHNSGTGWGSGWSISAITSETGITSIVNGTNTTISAIPSSTTSTRGLVQLSSAVNSTSTTTAATASAVKSAYDLAASKANASHGNHVPATQTANSAVFLRNDNTWQTVTPANIGAATASHTHNYAGSSSAGGAATTALACTGNSATATKLATARTISLTGSVTGSGTFDGSGNLSIATSTNHTHNYAGSSSAGGAANSALACTGNSATATKLQTARTINGTSFDGSANITITAAANGGTSTATSYVNVNNTEVKNSGRLQFFQKSSDTTINPDSGWWSTVRTQHTGYDNGYWQEMAYSFSSDVIKFRRNVNGTLSSWRTLAFTDSSITGNAATATKLQTARTINGTSFDGSAAITTANWGTARTITIGSTGKSVNGAANVSWTLAEIGAAAASHTHNYAGSSSAGGAANSALTCTGNSATATSLATARNLTIGSTAKSFNGTANVSWSHAELGTGRAYSGAYSFGGDQTAMTTAAFITLLSGLGAFSQPYWVARGSWTYASNRYINDTGCGNIHLAGCTVEVMGNSSTYTIRVHTPTTSASGVSSADFIYINNGSAYSPGWRRLYSTSYKPSPADIGAVATSGNNVISGKLDVYGLLHVVSNGVVYNVFDEISNLKSSVSSGKTAIASAITAKGVAASGSDTHATLANKISQIPKAPTGLTVNSSVSGFYRGSIATPSSDSYFSGSAVLSDIMVTITTTSSDSVKITAGAGDIFIFENARYAKKVGAGGSYSAYVGGDYNTFVVNPTGGNVTYVAADLYIGRMIYR